MFVLSAGLAVAGLGLTPAAAHDEAAGVRTAQFWPFGPPQQAPRYEEPRRSPSYYYVQPRDAAGRPGPVYRVLGVEKPRRKGVDRHKMRAAEQLRKAPPPPPTTGPLLVHVSLARQQLTLFDQGVPVATSPVSTGTPRNPTPTGVFSVIQKQWWHRSNLYSSAPMPFMQRLTWSGIAIHAGELPGYPASHGCIRLPDDFAIRMWGTTRMGARVIITHGDIAPVEIAHPRLFTPRPKQKDDPKDAPMASGESLRAQATEDVPAVPPIAQVGQFAIAELPPAAAAPVASAATAPALATGDSAPAAVDSVPAVADLGRSFALVNPDGSPIVDDYDAVEGEDHEDQSDTVTVTKTIMETRTISIIRPGQPTEHITFREPRKITVTQPRAEAPSANTITVVRGGRATEIEVLAVAQVTPSAAMAMPLPLPEDDEFPLILVAQKGNGAFAAARKRRSRNAQPIQPQMMAPAPQARPLRPGPISVFVSRKERRLYVRKGFEPLFDVPVTIANPERALGNHVFTALSVSENDARWNVVSVPAERIKQTQVSDRKRSYRRGPDGRLVRVTRKPRFLTEVVQLPLPATPQQALDRIDMPQEAVIRITELLSTGATLIVSDEGLGPETGRETDFTVLTK